MKTYGIINENTSVLYNNETKKIIIRQTGEQECVIHANNGDAMKLAAFILQFCQESSNESK